jgi:hypothetical protein
MESIAMKHPIYRPIAIGALLALASLGARAADVKDVSTKPDTAPVAGPVTKVSQASHALITLAA